MTEHDDRTDAEVGTQRVDPADLDIGTQRADLGDLDVGTQRADPTDLDPGTQRADLAALVDTGMTSSGGRTTTSPVTGSTDPVVRSGPVIPTEALASVGHTRRLVPKRRPQVHDRRLGTGLVELPKVVDIEPADAVLDFPVIPEGKRTCWRCGRPVGRNDGEGAGDLAGTCPHCGAR